MATKTKSTKAVKKPAVKHIGLVKNDAYLQPYEDAIRGRHEHALWKLNVLTNNGKTKLTDFANGHKYYGLQKKTRGRLHVDGCSASGHRTQRKSTLWATSTIGKKTKNIKQNASTRLATGS